MSGRTQLRRATRALVPVLVAMAAVPLLSAAESPRTLLVNCDGTPEPGVVPNGSARNPFLTIGDALAAAAFGDTVQVLPTNDECAPPTVPCACAENVTMKSGVDLLGSGASVTTIMGDGTEPVVLAPVLAVGTRLEGFTVTGGGGRLGAGIRATFGSPTITRNIIEGNDAVGTETAAARGGGIYLYLTGAEITDNQILDNNAGTAADGHGGLGGGILSRLGTPRIQRNVISGNVARASFDAFSAYLFGYGGGIELQAGAASLNDNLVVGNSAGLGGGGIDIYGGAHFISNNTIDGNCAGFTDDVVDCLTGLSPPPPGFSYGGGIEIVSATNPTLFNNLITNNTAGDGGGGIDTYPAPGPPLLRFVANDVYGNTSIADPAANEYSGLQLCDDASPVNAGSTCNDDADCSDASGPGTCQVGATGIAGNVSVDPIYDMTPACPFLGLCLSMGSPVIDAGRDGLREFAAGPDGIDGTADDQLTFLAPLSETDLEGKPRSLDAVPAVRLPGEPPPDNADLGALEFSPGPVGDLDNDGVPEDGDGSGTPGDNPCTGGAVAGCDDNCPTVFNDMQSDGDADGVGDACDLCPMDADPDQKDIDRDRLGDACDPDQDNDQVLEDGDSSGMPGDNPCATGQTTGCDDNCPDLFNSDQTDSDGDGFGDACDCAPLDPTESEPAGDIGDTLGFPHVCVDVGGATDGTPCSSVGDCTAPFDFDCRSQSTLLSWADPGNADLYHLYRGNLLTLRSLCQYTQDPAVVASAEQFCDLTVTSQDDPFLPDDTTPVFYLVTADNACGETILGLDSAENLRENLNPCP